MIYNFQTTAVKINLTNLHRWKTMQKYSHMNDSSSFRTIKHLCVSTRTHNQKKFCTCSPFYCMWFCASVAVLEVSGKRLYYCKIVDLMNESCASGAAVMLLLALCLRWMLRSNLCSSAVCHCRFVQLWCKLCP